MTAISRVRVGLSGFIGEPGVSTFYFLNTLAVLPALHAFYTSLKTQIPQDVQITVANNGDVLDAATGALTGSWSTDPVAPVQGTGAGNYSAPTGVLVRWLTSEVRDKHRVKGRTFIVPAGTDNFGTNGQVNSYALDVFRPAAAALVAATSPDFVIWHRPFKGSPAVGTRPARPAHDGAAVIVVGSDASTKAVVLRSRRD